MPTYEYACRECDEHTEAQQSFSDAPLTECPSCGGPLRKVFGNIAIAFKGSGFYKTDSRSTKGGAKAGKAGGDGGTERSSGSDGSSSGTSDTSSKPESTTSDASKPDSKKSESTKPESTKSDSARSDKRSSSPAAAAAS